MANEPLPDGIAEGETAYVVVSHHRAGVGGWPTAHRVKVTKITATQVRVTGDYTGGSEVTFSRRKGLTRPGSGSSSRDDRLAGRNDPDVRKAHLLAEVYAAIDPVVNLTTGSTLNGATRISPARLASDIDGNIDLMLDVLAELRDAATRAHTRLMHVKEVLR